MCRCYVSFYYKWSDYSDRRTFMYLCLIKNEVEFKTRY